MARRSRASRALPGTGGRGGSCPLAEARPAAAGPAAVSRARLLAAVAGRGNGGSRSSGGRSRRWPRGGGDRPQAAEQPSRLARQVRPAG
eukprot:16450365-Heterocapsa_arctica.AAC.1